MAVTYIPRAFGGTLTLVAVAPTSMIPTAVMLATFRDGDIERAIYRDGDMKTLHRDGDTHAAYRDGSTKALHRDGIAKSGGR